MVPFYTFKSLVVFILAFSMFQPFCEAINCKGCTPLDSVSFNKLLSKFKVSVVKFDVAYPYGEKHEEFAKFSQDASEIEDIFVGESRVQITIQKFNKINCIFSIHFMLNAYVVL